MRITAHSNDALLKRGTEFIQGRSPVLILAGTREAANDFVRSCCQSQSGALIGVYRHTLRDLVLTVTTASMVERGISPVRRLTREAMAVEIAARSRAKLTYLAPVAQFPGFARALARTLEDLRLNGITPDQIHSTGRSGPDLALLLGAYELALEERHFADHAERCTLALKNIAPRALLQPVREARLFYSTLRGNYSERLIALTEDTREAAESVLLQIDTALRNGELPAAPRTDGCAYCDFLPICGPYEEERVAGKSKVETRKLRNLREQP